MQRYYGHPGGRAWLMLSRHLFEVMVFGATACFAAARVTISRCVIFPPFCARSW